MQKNLRHVSGRPTREKVVPTPAEFPRGISTARKEAYTPPLRHYATMDTMCLDPFVFYSVISILRGLNEI
jgi:hypothetical protein